MKLFSCTSFYTVCINVGNNVCGVKIQRCVSSVANFFMQVYSNCKRNIIFSEAVLILLKCSPVLAIPIPYCATYGIMNLAHFQAKNN